MDIDDAYANAPYIPDAARYPVDWMSEGAAYRARLATEGRARLGVMYGHGSRHQIDLFLPDGVPSGLAVFVHGGYWLKFDNSYWSHLAEGARANGWAVAVPSYDLAPRVRIAEITRQIAQAVSVCAREVSGPIRLAGHSAGGHLVARLAMPGVLPDAIAARLARVMPISPVADLRPLMHTQMNQDLQIDTAEAYAESPTLGKRLDVPVTVWVGGDERPVFLEQAAGLAQAWQAEHIIAPGKHHFNVIAPLADPDSEMVARWLA